MALYKDGKVYRTYEEQVDHLTEAHVNQLQINDNVSKSLQELGVAANLGGYNLVRFAFARNGEFYHFREGLVKPTIPETWEDGDFFEITSGNVRDIPAYGYIALRNGELWVNIVFGGDYIENYTSLTITNITKNEVFVSSQQRYLTVFEGTSLLDYNPNENKKQVFNVLEDLTYNTRTQYVSFDLNRDDNYSFVFLGAVVNGKNGASVYATDVTDIEEIVNKMTIDDLILFGDNNTTQLVNPNAIIGDVYRFNSDASFSFVGNIRGEKGEKGDEGDKGDQGLQGVQGVQGIQGEKGDKGDKGEPGNQGLTIFTGVLNSPSQLPAFAETKVGDAYRIINTSGAIVTYDLYFHAQNGTDWDIQSNWGGVKGDKGDKGDQGIQGIQGVQGVQGEKGQDGGVLHAHYITLWTKNEAGYSTTVSPRCIIFDKKDTPFSIEEFLNTLSNFAFGVMASGTIYYADDYRAITYIYHNNRYNDSEITIGYTYDSEDCEINYKVDEIEDYVV